jgi:CBS domain-containing protein
MDISEIRTRGVNFCGPKDTLATAAELMWNCDCGAIPVLGVSGKLEGVITDRDICLALATRKAVAPDVHVEEVMSGRLDSCTTGDTVSHVLGIMREAQLRRIPILDLQGLYKGMVSVNDILEGVRNLQCRATREALLQETMLTLMAISQRHQPHSLQLAEIRAMVPGA